jgi:hypothetical protein
LRIRPERDIPPASRDELMEKIVDNPRFKLVREAGIGAAAKS